jgi:hypothetical protein
MIKYKKIVVIVLMLFFIISFSYAKKTVEKGKDIIKIGQDYKVTGVIEKDILIISGNLDIEGEVKGDVVVIWGSVSLSENSKIDKDLILIGSRIKKGKRTIVEGKITEFNSIKELKRIYKEYSGEKEKRFISYNDFLYYLLWLLLLILTYSFIPAKIEKLSEIIQERTLRNLVIGFILYIIFIIAIVVFAVMSLFLIGIPFLLAFALLIFILKVLTRTAMSFIFGTWMKDRFKFGNISPIIILSIGLLFILLLKKLPYFGSLIIIILDFIGFGAIYYFKKIKTKE